MSDRRDGKAVSAEACFDFTDNGLCQFQKCIENSVLFLLVLFFA